jgi:hypothetical protein
MTIQIKHLTVFSPFSLAQKYWIFLLKKIISVNLAIISLFWKKITKMFFQKFDKLNPGHEPELC